MSFNYDLLNQLNTKINNLIDEYEKLPDFSPFSIELFDEIKTKINDFINKTNNYIADFVDKEAIINNDIEALINQYKEDANNKLLNLNNAIKEITENTKTGLENNNKEEKRIEELYKEDSLNRSLGVNYFISKNEQNIQMFEREYSENVNSYDFQIKSAKETYHDNIVILDDEMNEKINFEDSKFNNDMGEYDETNKRIKERYDNKILESNLKLNDLSSTFSAIQRDQKENKHNDTIELNDKIRIIFEDNNRLLLEEKNNYDKDKTVNKIEKDSKHQDYILNSKRIANDFFLSMQKIDESTNNSKKSYNNNYTNSKKKFESELYIISKHEENEIKKILAESSNKNEKLINIKLTRNKYYKKAISKQKEANNEYNDLLIKYKLEQEKNNYNKSLLDINRKYNHEAIDEKESLDNKYFQEVNNSDEIDYNYKTKILNYVYNEKANKIRYEATLKEIDLDSKFDSENAKYQKSIQELMNEVKKIKSELDSIKDLQVKVKEIETERHNTTINYLKVYYLLEIEKFKALYEFNNKSYELNKKNSETILNFSKKNIEMQNENETNLNEVVNEIKNYEKNKEINEIKFKNTYLIEKSNHNVNLNKTNYYLSNNIDLYHFFKNRFSFELKLLHNSLSNYTLTLKNVEFYLIDILKLVIEKINITSSNLTFVRGFIKELIKPIIEFEKSIDNYFQSKNTEYIDERIRFESHYKYIKQYEKLNDDYKNNSNKIAKEKADIDDEILKNKKTIIELQKHISTLKSQRYYVNEHINKNNKKEIKKKLLEFDNEIDKNQAEILNLNNSRIPLENKSKELLSKLQNTKIEYEKNIKEIEDIETKSTDSYFTLKKRYSHIIPEFTDSFNKVATDFNDDINNTNYINTLINKRNEIISVNNKLVSSLYNAINDFENEVIESYNKEFDILTQKNKETINIINEEHNKKMFEIDKDFKLLRLDIDKNILESKLKKRKLDQQYQRVNRQFNKQYNDELEHILYIKNLSQQQFYDDYYAISSNQEDIVSHYKQKIVELDTKSVEMKNEVVENVNLNSIKLDNELKKFIHTKDVLIKNIPDDTKNKKKELRIENKKKNRDLKIQRINAKNNYIKEKNISINNMAQINSNLRQKLISAKKRKLRDEKSALRKYNNNIRKINTYKNSSL